MNTMLVWAKLLIRNLFFFPYSMSGLIKRKVIYLNVSIHRSLFFNKRYNWGDDLNYLFLRKIIRNDVVIYDWSVFSKSLNTDNYLCIGSIIEYCSNSRSIVWGAGCISKDIPFKNPKKVLAVRGPLTRRRLLDAGVSCPEVYGDPALLLPFFYKPRVKKKYKIGVIPHYVDNDCQLVNFLRNNDVKVIDLKNYLDFRDIIDGIYECEFILSSSLHGLIVADAYEIPNIWVEFSNNVIGDGFKFYDYFLSVGRSVIKPLLLSAESDWEKLNVIDCDYVKPNIDLFPLKNSCPFELIDNVEFFFDR